MCGLAGIIGKFAAAEGLVLIQKMLQAILHRGPDSNGFWVDDGIAFGMQRLSIIDVANGDQPIWSDDDVCIVFNGEIYNFKTIRAELVAHGQTFKTHSDTEVILHLYRKEGINAITRLEGMFAICLYDARINQIYLVRDRLGKKPLYYYHFDATFAFASEIKSILDALPQRPDIHLQAIWDQLTLRYVPSPETIWKHISKLEPGHYLQLDLPSNTYKVVKYWELSFVSTRKDRERNYDNEFANLFLEAVDKRLLAADVPVGILLSGGLDSSCVAAAAVELGHKNFHTFSVGFADGEPYNELKYARKVAEHIKSQHHEIIIDQDQFLDFVDELVWFSDEPLADLASIPLFYVSKLAAEHVKVVLSGEGADEILAGYNFDQLAKKLNILKIASILPRNLLRLFPFQSFKDIADVGYKKFIQHNGMHITQVFTEVEKNNLCKFKPIRNTESFIKDLYKMSASDEPLDHIMQGYCNSWLVEDLLMKADKMSMAASIELRVPFLDHKLVEWAASLPLECKIGSFTKGFGTKKILRKFAAERLPQEIITRPKQGFPVPAYKWIKDDLFEYANNKLNNPLITRYLHAETIESIFNDLKDGSEKAAYKIWNLLILSAWLKRWAD